jgi:hypothetical protein
VNSDLFGLEAFAGFYLNNILVFKNTWFEYLMHFNKLHIASELQVSQFKSLSVFAIADEEFLGHTVRLDKVQPCQQTVQVLVNFWQPTIKQQLHSLIGLARYGKKFVPNCYW